MAMLTLIDSQSPFDHNAMQGHIIMIRGINRFGEIDEHVSLFKEDHTK